MSKKLHELVAIEKGVKQRCYNEITEIHNRSKSPDLFKGLHKEYKPLDEAGEKLPAETAKVQHTVADSLRRAAKLESEAIDVRASKDASNCLAKADVIVAGVTLAKDVPVSTLLDLEKRFKDCAKFISELPEQDSSEDWEVDPNDKQMFRTDVKQTHRTTKITDFKTVAAATEQHPAQVVQISKDVIAGYWHLRKFSGAISRDRKRELLDECNKRVDAIKQARERANATDAVSLEIGTSLFDFLHI